MVEDAIIEIDVGLQAKSKSEIDEYLAKTEAIKDNLEKIRNSTKDNAGDDTTSLSSEKKKKKSKKKDNRTVKEKRTAKENTEKKKEEKAKKKEKSKLAEKTELTEMLESLDDAEVQKLGSFLKNPQSFLKTGMERLLTTLGPNSAVILGLAGAIIAAPILYIEIMKALSVKGGPFNRDWRRLIQREIDIGLSREFVKLREIGATQTILTQQRGFVPNNPQATYNSLYHVNESRLSRIGLSDRDAGVTYGK